MSPHLSRNILKMNSSQSKENSILNTENREEKTMTNKKYGYNTR